MILNPAIEAVIKGLQSVNKYKVALVRVLTLPFILYFFVALLSPHAINSLAIQIAMGFFSFAIYVYICVATHRVIILPSARSTNLQLIHFGKREWQFFLATFEIMFYCLPTLIFLFIPYIGFYITIAAGAYITSRMSLIFPSVAIDAPMKASASWTATSRHQIKMFTVVFLFSIFFSGIELGLSNFTSSNVLQDMFSTLTVVFLVSALSEAYKTIMNELS